MSAIADRQSGLGDGARLTSTGLKLDETLEYDRWAEIGLRLAQMANATSWAIGDWVFHGQWKWGSKYELALEATGLEYQTLRNYASVAGRFDLSRRRDTVSFSHHAAVAALPPADQQAWLDRAERFSWSSKELQERVRRERELGKPEDITPPPVEHVRFTVEPARAARWQRAADLLGVSLAEWAARALDAAAATA